MNALEPTPIDGLYPSCVHGFCLDDEQNTVMLSPTPIGPNATMDVVDVVSTTSLFETMDHTTTNFLKEMFCAPLRTFIPTEALLLDASLSQSPSSMCNENLKKLSCLLEDMCADNDSRDRLPEAIQSGNFSNRLLANCVCDTGASSDFSMSSSDDEPLEDEEGAGGGLLPMKSHWSVKFGELVEFKRRFGHCLVPNNWNENIKLSQWVKRQRHQYKIKKEGKNSSLTQEKVYALEALGFTWSVQEDTWEERFNELVEYKRMYGHTNVPKNCKRHPRLSVWVKYQRRHLRLYMSGERSSMTEERFFKLTKLGFQWNPRKEKLNCFKN